MPQDLLLALAQISLGLAGFAGLVGVFRRSEADWVAQDVLGLRFILQRTFAAMGISLVPSFLLLCHLPESTSIAAASLSSALLYALILVVQLIQLRHLASDQKRPRSSRLTVFAVLASDAAMIALQATNTFLQRSNVLVAGILWLLAIAVHQFFVIALSGATSQSPRDGA